MHRIDSNGATEDGKFTEGNPVIPIPPTVVSDDWLNAVQEEIAHVIEGAGLTLDKADDRQLKAAILAYLTLQAVPPVRRINTVAPLEGGGALNQDLTLSVKSSIGMPIQAGMLLPMSGDKLDDNCVWPDGSLVLFADWPDLEARFLAGYIKALPKGTAAATIADNPGLWMQHDSGLYLPSLGGLFSRTWTPSQTEDAGRAAGSKQGDAIRNITGSLDSIAAVMTNSLAATGVFSTYTGTGDYTEGGNYSGYKAGFRLDVSRQVPTAAENRPLNYAQPVQIYLGRNKTEVL